MVKFYESSFSYDYSFPAVALAYFLRYPNPYSTHVLSTDVIERTFDPRTQRLHTVRLHLKRSKLPAAVLRILPRSILGPAARSGDSQSYILERSTIDVRTGRMETEARNLEWTGVLSVIERQSYRRREVGVGPEREDERTRGAFFGHDQEFNHNFNHGHDESRLAEDLDEQERTDVTTTVQLLSRLGQNRWKRTRAKDKDKDKETDEAPAKLGFLRSWSTTSLQRSIELIGLKRAQGSQPKSKEGMKVVLERLRRGGIVAVLEGMRRDGEALGRMHTPWNRLHDGREGDDFADSDDLRDA